MVGPILTAKPILEGDLPVTRRAGGTRCESRRTILGVDESQVRLGDEFGRGEADRRLPGRVQPLTVSSSVGRTTPCSAIRVPNRARDGDAAARAARTTPCSAIRVPNLDHQGRTWRQSPLRRSSGRLFARIVPLTTLPRLATNDGRSVGSTQLDSRMISVAYHSQALVRQSRAMYYRGPERLTVRRCIPKYRQRANHHIPLCDAKNPHYSGMTACPR